jgi:hypothetical protein
VVFSVYADFLHQSTNSHDNWNTVECGVNHHNPNHPGRWWPVTRQNYPIICREILNRKNIDLKDAKISITNCGKVTDLSAQMIFAISPSSTLLPWKLNVRSLNNKLFMWFVLLLVENLMTLDISSKFDAHHQLIMNHIINMLLSTLFVYTCNK